MNYCCVGASSQIKWPRIETDRRKNQPPQGGFTSRNVLSVEKLETLPADTKPKVSHHRPFEAEALKMRRSKIFLVRRKKGQPQTTPALEPFQGQHRPEGLLREAGGGALVGFASLHVPYWTDVNWELQGLLGGSVKLVLHEWIPFVIFRARSRERWQLSLPGRFLSRCCITLCRTMEVEPRIAMQYKCHHCCSCKISGERGWRVGKKCLRRVCFFAGQKIVSSCKEMRFGASYSTSNKLLLVARHILTTGLQKCL